VIKRMTASQLRDQLSLTLNRVAYGGERIVLSRSKKDVAALISLSDLDLLLLIESHLAAVEAQEASVASQPGQDPVIE